MAVICAVNLAGSHRDKGGKVALQFLPNPQVVCGALYWCCECAVCRVWRGATLAVTLHTTHYTQHTTHWCCECVVCRVWIGATLAVDGEAGERL